MKGEIIKERFSQIGETQIELAKLLDVHLSTISEILSSWDVKTGTLERISKALNLSLFFFEDVEAKKIINSVNDVIENSYKGKMRETSKLGEKVQELLSSQGKNRKALCEFTQKTEAGLAPKWTLDTEAELNDWTMFHGRRWKHWAVQPETRYWLCQRFSGHFFGVHVHGGQYNIGGFDSWYYMLGTNARKLKDSRYQGWFAVLGKACGYASFEGSYKHNEELSRSRVNALFSYVQKLHSFNASDITTLKKPENWDGLKKYVEDSNLEHKTEIFLCFYYYNSNILNINL